MSLSFPLLYILPSALLFLLGFTCFFLFFFLLLSLICLYIFSLVPSQSLSHIRALDFYQQVPFYLLNLLSIFLGVYKKITINACLFFFCLFVGVKIFFYYILRNKKTNKTIGKQFYFFFMVV